jgi:hypothetical protein
VEQTIEVRYAGVVIGRATSVADSDASGVFLGLGDPMPVGTTVSVQVAGDVVDGRVEQVAESADPAKCGMRIRFDDPSALSLFGVPGAPARVAKPAATSPAPVVNVNVPAAQAASSPDGTSDSSGDAADGDADRGPTPDAAGSGADSGGQAGGGGRRRRRRR